MKTKQTLAGWLALAALAIIGLQASTGFAQGTTAFTYQGQLRDGGTNASGAYTMMFKLYDSLNGGNQIGSGITNAITLGNGLFTVNLDFGAGAFNGNARWLDITVSNGVAQTLTPRVQVLPAPYAQFAAIAATVTNNAITSTLIANNAVANRNLSANAVNATNIASSQIVKTLDGLTDAVSLTAGNNVTLTTNGNVLQISALAGSGGGVGGIPRGIQVIPSSGTFTVPAGVSNIMVEMWGGGAGGGSAVFDGTNIYTGGGGGAGAYAWNLFSVTPGAQYTVTVGSGGAAASAGGASSFGALMSSPGGNPGGNGGFYYYGNGGSKSASPTGSLVPAQGNAGQDAQAVSGAGLGGTVWRGDASGVGHTPGGGGEGAGNVGSGGGGGSGLVIVYW